MSPKWFEDCAKSGKRLPEDAYLMKWYDSILSCTFVVLK